MAPLPPLSKSEKEQAEIVAAEEHTVYVDGLLGIGPSATVLPDIEMQAITHLLFGIPVEGTYDGAAQAPKAKPTEKKPASLFEYKAKKIR